MTVDISSLSIEGSPRLDGENKEHTRMLVEASTKLPPVLVHRPTMRVIDGAHRLQAARLRGERTIGIVFFDGDDDTAFVEAVRANIAHGLPLTLTDRRAAAERILRSHGQWSDRAIAQVTGLAAATIRSLRRRITEQSAQLPTRVGRDGKARPLDAAPGRRRAANMIAERPDASLREVADVAGISTRTARDVRKRLQSGQDPVPAGGRTAATSVPGNRRHGSVPNGSNRSNGPRLQHRARIVHQSKDTAALLDGLRKDPSLRYTEPGRQLVRCLDTHFVEPAEVARLAEALPPHCAYIVIELASRYAEAWRSVAASFTSRIDESTASSAAS